MKKTDLKKKLNRNNNTIFGHRASPTNIITTSDIFEDHIWVQNEGHTTSGVQIVELRSSDSGKSGILSDDEKDYFPIPNHQWCYTRQNREDDYTLNEAARVREENRQKERNNTTFEFSTNTSEYNDDFVYAEVFVSGPCDMENENVIYNQMNCFTILDKHLRNSETSDEDFGDIEVINCNDTNQEWQYECRNYDDDIIKCEPNNENEKRTVWIYSFKNKHLLSENDYELVNIPSLDGSSQSSIEDFQQNSIENDVRRVSSPVPPLYVPRLNLPSTPPLPTVTEVTEPGRKSSANQTEEATSLKMLSLRENNWFMSEHRSATKVEVVDKSTSIVNWMALSPREKRRRFRNTSPISLPSDLTNHMPTLNEVSSQIEKSEELKASKLVEILTKDIDDTCECGDRGEDNVKFCRDQSTMTEDVLQNTSSLNRSQVSALEQTGSCILDSAKKSVRTIRSNLASNRENHSKSSNELNIEVKVHTPRDRGDHLPGSRPKPRIKINNKTDSRNITDPMENIESSNWIYEEKLIKDPHVRTPIDAKGDRASDAIWIRNMALLKPAEWAAYEPIFEAQSIPSLHLSMNTDSIEENQTLFRRVSKYFNCCKLFFK